MIPLKWTSACLDSSGYAEASRNYISALHKSEKVNLTLSITSFENQKTDHSEIGRLCGSLVNKKDVPYKINVVHLTPENFPTFVERDKYNIGYTVWETDSLPKDWVPLCNMMDEIWVPSKWNKNVFIHSGVTKPIYIIPHCLMVDTSEAKEHISMGVSDDTFIFYSVFQWIVRKNPIDLLKAYFTEFKKDEKVCLALKTYRLNTSVKEKDVIKQDIQKIKHGLNLQEYPQIIFFGDLFSNEVMKAFYQKGDCFVLPCHAEGWGICYATAMAYGKPTIGTKYGGQLDFMNSKNSYLIKCQESPVFNMIFPNYDGSMNWADPNISHLKKLMRYVYENREEAKTIGLQGKKDIEELYNPRVVSDLITKRLEEILKVV